MPSTVDQSDATLGGHQHRPSAHSAQALRPPGRWTHASAALEVPLAGSPPGWGPCDRQPTRQRRVTCKAAPRRAASRAGERPLKGVEGGGGVVCIKRRRAPSTAPLRCSRRFSAVAAISLLSDIGGRDEGGPVLAVTGSAAPPQQKLAQHRSRANDTAGCGRRDTRNSRPGPWSGRSATGTLPLPTVRGQVTKDAPRDAARRNRLVDGVPSEDANGRHRSARQAQEAATEAVASDGERASSATTSPPPRWTPSLALVTGTSWQTELIPPRPAEHVQPGSSTRLSAKGKRFPRAQGKQCNKAR